MVDDRQKELLEKIRRWKEFDDEIKKNVVTTNSTFKPFPELMTNDKIELTKSFVEYIHNKAEQHNGVIKIKRDMWNKMLKQIDKNIMIHKGYVPKKDDNGKVPSDERAKTLPNTKTVGQLRATVKQFYPQDTVTNCTSKDYIRYAIGE